MAIAVLAALVAFFGSMEPARSERVCERRGPDLQTDVVLEWHGQCRHDKTRAPLPRYVPRPDARIPVEL